MSDGRGLLEDIEKDLLAGKPLADLLRKTIILGGRAGSTELREWAARELKGFIGVSFEDMPGYRIIQAPLLMDSVNARAQVKHQPLPLRMLPDFAKEVSEDFPVRHGIGELEAWVARAEPIQIAVPGGDIIGATLARTAGDPTLQIYAVYWAIDHVTVAGVLDRVRTSLAELISELIVVTPPSDDPTSEQVAHAVNIVIHGGNPRFTVAAAQSSTGGYASLSSGEGSQDGWWNRSRQLGALIVGLATVVSAVAAVIVF
jgi:hypothetical protein